MIQYNKIVVFLIKTIFYMHNYEIIVDVKCVVVAIKMSPVSLISKTTHRLCVLKRVCILSLKLNNATCKLLMCHTSDKNHNIKSNRKAAYKSLYSGNNTPNTRGCNIAVS